MGSSSQKAYATVNFLLIFFRCHTTFLCIRCKHIAYCTRRKLTTNYNKGEKSQILSTSSAFANRRLRHWRFHKSNMLLDVIFLKIQGVLFWSKYITNKTFWVKFPLNCQYFKRRQMKKYPFLFSSLTVQSSQFLFHDA